MDTDNKKEFTQDDWEGKNGLRSQLQKEGSVGRPFDLGSILDAKGFSRQIKNIRFSNFGFHNFIFEHLQFHDCNFLEHDFRNTSFSHLQFIGCNCTKVKWLDSRLMNITFNECTLSQSEMVHSEFKNVSIENSKLPGSYWNNAQLSKLHIYSSTLNESVFYSSSIHNSSISSTDLQDVFWIQNTGEFLKTNCSISSTDRPVIGITWDFLQRGRFSPYIDDVLRDNGAIVLKIEMQPKSIDESKLFKEVKQCLNDISESESPIIHQKLFCQTFKKPEVNKIEQNVSTLLDYCCALVLPGGNDIEPEFYTIGLTNPRECDYRRSVTEFSLLTHAHKRKIPVMGICRGSQMINVYFGGTLRSLSKFEMDWQYLPLSNSSKKGEIQQWINGTNLLALSMHHQAADKIGNGLEIIIEHEGIPKLLISYDAQFIAVQFHPESYIVEDFMKEYPEAIHNKGIYQFFFSKILQYLALTV